MKRNSGIEKEDILRNQFTGYVKRAVHNRRIRYLMQLSKRQQKEIDLTEAEMFLYDISDKVECSIEYIVLRQSLDSLKKKEYEIVLQRIVGERNFSEIAKDMGMTYKAVTSLYYRSIKKLQEVVKGDDYI